MRNWIFFIFLFNLTGYVASLIPKVLIVHAGVDNLDIFTSNYRHLKNQQGSRIQLNCLIILSENYTQAIENIVGNSCQITEYYRGEFTDYAKLLTPSLIRKAGYSHVILLDSRTKLAAYSIKIAVDVMEKNNLDVAIPYLQHPGEGKEGAREKGALVEILELFAPIFTVNIWQCFWDMINPGINPSGSGYDIYFYHFCLQRMVAQPSSESRQQSLKIARINSLRIGVLPPVEKWFVKSKSEPQVQLRNWIEYIRNERGGIIRKGEKGDKEELIE